MMKSILRTVALFGVVVSGQLGGPALTRGGGSGNKKEALTTSLSLGDSTTDKLPSALLAPIVADFLPEDLIENQFQTNPYEGQDEQKLIMDGTFQLVNVNMKHGSGEVMGQFCAFDFKAQEDDPSKVPTMIDLVSLSTHCQENVVFMPLSEMADAARAHDEGNSSLAPLPVGGFIFHQPKSGSSILSNAVASAGHRVISESNVLANILNCQDCSELVVHKSLVDALYLLSRDEDKRDTSFPKKVYVKLLSTNGLYTVHQAYPDAKMVYLYRDPNVVLQKLMNCKSCKRFCALKQRRNPSHELEHYLWEHDVEDTSELNDESLCAAGLASQTLMAVDDPKMTGHFVSYESLLTPEGLRDALEALDVVSTTGGSLRRLLKDMPFTSRRANKAREEKFDAEKDAVIVSDSVREANERFLSADLKKRRFRM